FEDTLDEALDSLFGGDSGAQAGDSDVDPVPGEEGEPDAPETDLQTQLDAAIQQAGAALQERQAAYAENDLVAAAEADERLTAALAQAIQLSAQIDGDVTAEGVPADGAPADGGETPAPETAPEETTAP